VTKLVVRKKHGMDKVVHVTERVLDSGVLRVPCGLIDNTLIVLLFKTMDSPLNEPTKRHVEAVARSTFVGSALRYDGHDHSSRHSKPSKKGCLRVSHQD